jgi:hypothetical protein
VQTPFLFTAAIDWQKRCFLFNNIYHGNIIDVMLATSPNINTLLVALKQFGLGS